MNVNLKILSHHWKLSINKQWVQFGIITLIVLTSTIISYWGTQRLFVLLLALLGGATILLLLIRQIRIGFVFLLLASMFVPFSGPGGVNATIFVIALMLVLWLLNMVVVERQFNIIKSRIVLPTVLFILVSILAFGMGQIPWLQFANQAPLDAQLGGFAVFALSLGFMLATAHLIQNTKWLEIIVWGFIGLSMPLVLIRAFDLPIGQFYRQGFTAQSMLWTWLVALMIGQLLFNGTLSRRFRWLLLIGLLLTFYVAMVKQNDWKSGWVPAALVVVIAVGLKYIKVVRFAIPFMLIGAISLVQYLIASDQYSWDTRVDAWRIVLEISKVSPILGLGFANYYWYVPLFRIRGFYVQFSSHNQYVDIIAQTGVLGLLCCVWLFFEIGRLAWYLMEHLPEGFDKAYSYGTFFGLIGCIMAGFLADWLLPFVYNIGLDGFRASILPWVFFGGLIAIEKIHLANKSRIIKDQL